MRPAMQSRIHCLSGCAVLAIIGGLVSAEATAAPLPLVAKHSGKCLDITGGPQATQNGALAEQWEMHRRLESELDAARRGRRADRAHRPA